MQHSVTRGYAPTKLKWQDTLGYTHTYAHPHTPTHTQNNGLPTNAKSVTRTSLLRSSRPRSMSIPSQGTTTLPSTTIYAPTHNHTLTHTSAAERTSSDVANRQTNPAPFQHVWAHSCVTWLRHMRHDSIVWDTTHSDIPSMYEPCHDLSMSPISIYFITRALYRIWLHLSEYGRIRWNVFFLMFHLCTSPIFHLFTRPISIYFYIFIDMGRVNRFLYIYRYRARK